MVDGRRHKKKDERRYSGGWKKTQNKMEGDPVVDGRRPNIGGKRDTVVDGRRHKIGWKGRYRCGWIQRWRDFEIQRYRGGGKETLR